MRPRFLTMCERPTELHRIPARHVCGPFMLLLRAARVWGCGIAGLACLLQGFSLSAQAQSVGSAIDESADDPEQIGERQAQALSVQPARTEPAHWIAFGGLGLPLRLTLDDDLDQSRLAPLYADITAGYLLPGGRLRHGFGLGVSWNFGHDGGYTEPVYSGDQVALMPTYLAYYKWHPDVFLLGHAGIPFLVRGGPNVGLEAGALVAYRILAGTGVYAELNLAGWLGAQFNLLASITLGVVFDYEVLP